MDVPYLTPSGQPAFATLVVLDVSEAAALPSTAHAQIKLPYIGVGGKLFGRAIDNDLAHFHDVAVVGNRQGHRRVLLHQQHGCTLFRIDSGNDPEDVL